MARVYRDYAKRIDWQKTMARQWGEQVKGYVGRSGGWVYTKNGTPIIQGWTNLFRRCRTEILGRAPRGRAGERV